MYAGGSHRFVLLDGGSVPAADDRAGMSHAAARRRCLAGDESDDRLLHMLFDVFSRNFFCVAADFADHHDRVRVGIVVEHANRIEKAGADDWIAANADARGLPDPKLRQLADGFIGERAAAADDANISLLVNRCGHDAHLAFSGRDHAGTIRSYQTRIRIFHRGGHAHHVERRHALR